MEKIKDLSNQVYEKLNRELREYKRELREKNVDVVILSSYETAIKEEFPNLFSDCDYYSEYELRALLNLDNTLDELYNDWLLSDGGIHVALEDSMEDYISELAEEYIENEEEKIKSKPNYELIKNISDTFKTLDRYDFCDSLKSKYEIEDFDLIAVDRILNTKGGVSYLCYYFDELKDNNRLQYFNENSTICNEIYNNIKDKTIPKLNELLIETEKNSRGIHKESFKKISNSDKGLDR